MLRRIGRCLPRSSLLQRSTRRGVAVIPKEDSGLELPPTVRVIGAPMQYGQPRVGTDLAPGMLRKAGLEEAITKNGWRFEDFGDLEFPKPSMGDKSPTGKALNTQAVGQACGLLADAAEEAAKEGRFVLTLGGDHSVASGSIAGILRSRPSTGVLWVDAHADINTPMSSPSGNIHGMPVALLLGLIPLTNVPGHDFMDGVKLEPDRLVYVGLRALDEEERSYLRDLGILAFTMTDIDRYGIGEVMDRAIARLGTDSPIHLSWDVDGCDPSVMPSTGTPARGGLSYRESHFVCEAVASTGTLASMDIVEVNPRIGSEEDVDMTLENSLAIVGSALGATIL